MLGNGLAGQRCLLNRHGCVYHAAGGEHPYRTRQVNGKGRIGMEGIPFVQTR